MSNIRYLAGQLDLFWRNRSRDFGGFDKPQIVPAATLRRDCPMYLQRYLDQDPNSFYMFVAGDPLKHEDISREKACELFDQFFYEHMRMPSSYDIEAGGEYSREQAIDKEVLPARVDSAYRTFYDEQMDRMRAMEQGDVGEEAQAAEEKKDDDDVIDVELGADGTYQTAASKAASERSVGTSTGTAVGMPRKIWYGVDFHIPAGGGMLGYNRGENRLHGRRSSGFLREEGEFAERQAIAQMAECGLTEEKLVDECDASLEEFEPEADGSEYYGKVMEKVEAIVDDEVCEEDDVDECDIAEMIELGKKIR